MTQQIVNDYPPLYDEIAVAFGLKVRDPIIFSWGDRLYNPTRMEIPPELIAHEAVHAERQGGGQEIIDWWVHYIDSRAFRLAEEIPAHCAEYQHVLAHGNRTERRAALRVTAERLAAPLYGRMITPAEAIKALRTAERVGYL
ncbi:MAG: hypothetical protein IIB77_05340 [Proteobacteria bacterium]|nr:hypothetical protein [Pseudomonadota bacterium]